MILFYSQELNIKILATRKSMCCQIEIVMRFEIVVFTKNSLGQRVKLNMGWVYQY